MEQHYTPKVFLSGPMILYPNGKQLIQEALRLCRDYGFDPILNAQTLQILNPMALDKQALAQLICDTNRDLIASCDLILADCNEFRGGYQPYAGASFELGYAYTLEKKLYCYLSDLRSCEEKYGGIKKAYADGTPCDEEVRWFEPDCLNLMLWAPSTIVGGGLEDALKQAAADFFGGKEDA